MRDLLLSRNLTDDDFEPTMISPGDKLRELAAGDLGKVYPIGAIKGKT
jgi:hypothetical protein